MPVKRPEPPAVRPDAEFAALVLAAGAGRRFGGGKLTAAFAGGVLLDGALEAAFAAPVGQVVVVSGADDGVAPAALAFAAAQGGERRLRLVRAPDWDEGMSASLRAGLAALAAEVRGAFIFLGDMPRIPRALSSRLAERFTGEVQAVQPLHGGEPGHPVLLGASLFEAAMRLTGDQGARRLLEAAGAGVLRLEVDDAGVGFDIDTREALARVAEGR